MTPARIQRKRSSGWRMPANTIYVGRPTFWGNPFRGKWAAINYSRAVYAPGPVAAAFRYKARKELRGKNLACWCSPDEACHVDTLLVVANRPSALMVERSTVAWDDECKYYVEADRVGESCAEGECNRKLRRRVGWICVEKSCREEPIFFNRVDFEQHMFGHVDELIATWK